jgi:hypothetical protein
MMDDFIIRKIEEHNANPAKVPVYLSLVVWGREFVSFFLEFCLPSLLAPGNIPALRGRVGSKLLLHTTEYDLAIIQAAPTFKTLKALIDVETLPVHLTDDVEPHRTLSDCHQESLRVADAVSVPIVFLSPDTIWSDGSLAAVDRHLACGKRAVMLLSMRLVKETAEPAIRAYYGTSSGAPISCRPRDLNRFAFEFLHPSIEEYFFNKNSRGDKLLPMALFWEGPNGDFLAHSFHQHPLMVYPRIRFAEFLQTIDGDLVRACCPDINDLYVVQDSD